MSSTAEPPQGEKPARPAGLIPHFNTLQATALNMSNMVGIGPFITIPILMTALNGPQAMVGWVVALIIVVADGMVWSELGAAMPGTGGSYVYLREAFGRQTFGRLMAFLFIWQFILSGPLEIASGYIGFKNYLGYLWPELAKSAVSGDLVIIAIGLVSLWLLYREITHIGKITVSLWIGTLITMAAVIVTGAIHFDPQKAFDFPRGPFQFSLGFLLGLGAASRMGVYDYLGYYDICYIGEEVKNPGRVIPRSILISVAAVAVSYFAINISLIGVVPWREFVPYEATRPTSDFVVSIFMERTCGPLAAKAFTILVLWTALGSIFALLLGYSRIPYAAARDGYFFKIFAKLHPKKNFPYVSLLVVAVASILCGFWDIGMVIDAMLVTRILIQFIGQVFAVMLLRKRAPSLNRPYRIWFYPLPALVALAGWVFLFATSSPFLLELGLGSLLLGVPVFLFWSRLSSGWPFAPAQLSPATGSPGSESPSSGSGDKSRSG